MKKLLLSILLVILLVGCNQKPDQSQQSFRQGNMSLKGTVIEKLEIDHHKYVIMQFSDADHNTPIFFTVNDT